MKTIFDPAVRDELLKRVDAIKPQLQRLWGTMTVDQMVHHVNLTFAGYTGELAPAKVGGSGIKKRILKFLTLGPIPIPKGKAPTLTEYLSKESYPLEGEKKALRNYINRVSTMQSQQDWPESVVFGKMTGEEYGKLCYKHTDHHLSQFGV